MDISFINTYAEKRVSVSFPNLYTKMATYSRHSFGHLFHENKRISDAPFTKKIQLECQNIYVITCPVKWQMRYLSIRKLQQLRSWSLRMDI